MGNCSSSFNYGRKTPEDIYKQAMRHLKGYDGYDQSFIRGLNLLKAAVKENYGPALAQMGHFLETGYMVKKDIPNALAHYFRAAREEDAQGQYYLGRCHLKGIGRLRANPEEAAHYFNLADKQGLLDASVALADCFYQGIGTNKDEEEALKRYKAAAEKGHPAAQCFLGRLLIEQNNGSDGEGIDYLCKAAKQEHAAAEFHLAKLYYEGKVIQQSYKRAFHFFSKAAEHHYMDAHFFLGACYEKAHGVDQDLEQAAIHYRFIARENFDAMDALVRLNKPEEIIAVDSPPIELLAPPALNQGSPFYPLPGRIF